jgi:hypothetical protein
MRCNLQASIHLYLEDKKKLNPSHPNVDIPLTKFHHENLIWILCGQIHGKELPQCILETKDMYRPSYRQK